MVREENSSMAKLTLSYVHNACSFPFQYKTVAQSFDEMALQYPDHHCYVFKAENKRYTYATLKYEIDRLAMSFLELGFEKGDRLGIMLPNSSENVVLSYVVSKLGLIKVHMNPASVGREIACNINKVGCKGIVMTSSDTTLKTFKQAIPDFEEELWKSVPTLKHIILTGSSQSELASFRNVYSYNVLINQDTQNQARLEAYTVDPELPLSIYFTSGSTGLPKAVVLTNFGVLNTIALLHFQHGMYLSEHCTPLVMHHITTGTLGIFLPSTNICKVIIPDLMFNPEATMRAIHEEKCTSIFATPTLLRNILAKPNRHKYSLSSLQYVPVISTALQPEFLRMVEKELGITGVCQGYGMTETGNFLTNSCYAKKDDDRRYTAIGQCLPHIELKIVDNDGIIVPIGSEGEIWARSYSNMLGYYNDIEKTAETITNSGWLRTGDLARMDQDGYFFFVGRKKEIIIRASINIYPVEVELIIMEHPSVDEAYVFSIPDPLIDEVVCTFVKLKPGRKCEADELKVFLSNNLAPNKVPEHIEFVHDFSRTALGKVQKSQLAEDMMKRLKK